jgi:hypothetical protein
MIMYKDEIITVKHRVENFNKVIIHELQEADFTIIPSDHEELIIEGLSEIVNQIDTMIDEDTLVIKTEKPLLNKIRDSIRTSLDRYKTKYTLYIRELVGLDIRGVVITHCDNLSTTTLTLKHKGVGRTVFKNLQTENLGVIVTNVGEIIIDGKATEQFVTMKGTGTYVAKDLECEKAQIHLRGIADVKVWVTGELDVEINGIGTVSYYGSPKVYSKGSMLSTVHKLGDK